MCTCRHCIHLQTFCMSAYTKICSQYCNRNYTKKSAVNKLNLSVIWNISMITNAPSKFWSLVITGLADIDGFIIFIQECIRPRSWPVILRALHYNPCTGRVDKLPRHCLNFRDYLNKRTHTTVTQNEYSSCFLVRHWRPFIVTKCPIHNTYIFEKQGI